MKTASLLLIFMSILTISDAQEFISSRATLSSDNEIPPSKSVNVLIQLNEQTTLFSISSCIHLTPEKSPTDSTLLINRQMYLNFEAPFPSIDLDFYDSNYDEKIYTMNGELTINEITKPLRMDFKLTHTPSKEMLTYGIHSYPALISFTVEINPDNYSLGDIQSCFADVCFAKLLIIKVVGGTINRSNESGKKPECETN